MRCDHPSLEAGEKMLGRELTLFVWCLQASCLDVLAELLDSEEFSPTGAHHRGMFPLPSTSSLQPRDFASVCQFFKKCSLFVLPML